MDMDTWEWIAAGAGLAVVYFIVKNICFPSRAEPVPVAPRRKKIEKRDFTLTELREYDGTDPEKPILIGVRGNIYDVSYRESFYGPGNLSFFVSF